jgi:hypothetical protein
VAYPSFVVMILSVYAVYKSLWHFAFDVVDVIVFVFSIFNSAMGDSTASAEQIIEVVRFGKIR